MDILVVGSGGREHAIAWKAAQSPLAGKIYIAPGNAGTAELGINIPIQANDVVGLVNFCEENEVQLVIIGPEVSLEAGLTDALTNAGIWAFGPTQKAAELESSKAFAKAFMVRHNIPTARYASFRDYGQAAKYLENINYPVVIKASGLAAGKGVVLPESHAESLAAIRSMLLDHCFGHAGDEIIIEERLAGEEVSVLAFSDGKTVRILPPAQDHKRLLDHDQGPNTGGMGAYAPAPICDSSLLDTIEKTILLPTIAGMESEGRLFQGILYAGLMITENGPKVLEYNCRFGDPETQVLLPLLDHDLLDIVVACIHGALDQKEIRWKQSACVSVVLASSGYPNKYETGQPITVDRSSEDDWIVFHAGTRVENGKPVTSGGRVLNVTAPAPTIAEAVGKVYQAVEQIHFKGMVYRKDIAQKAFNPGQNSPGEKPSLYAISGVDIDAGNRAVDLMRNSVRSTYTSAVLAGIGAFGGLFDASSIKDFHHPVLVASTDGVGTKVRLAAQYNRYESIGNDIVNHCINDILVQGAVPLFFLDYFACSKLDPMIAARIVSGISSACREAGCVLIGGETAEMPGVYTDGEFDLAGTIVGVVEKERVLPRDTLHQGDLLVGFESSGPHTNGYSLIRKAFQGFLLDSHLPGSNISIIDALLEPHRSYLPVLQSCFHADPIRIKALAHITGGGFIENIPRILPDGLQAVIQKGSWKIPAIFQSIQRVGNITDEEMFRVFNMGIGMVAVVAQEDMPFLQQQITDKLWVIGQLVEGKKGVAIL